MNDSGNFVLGILVGLLLAMVIVAIITAILPTAEYLTCDEIRGLTELTTRKNNNDCQVLIEKRYWIDFDDYLSTISMP